LSFYSVVYIINALGLASLPPSPEESSSWWDWVRDFIQDETILELVLGTIRTGTVSLIRDISSLVQLSDKCCSLLDNSNVFTQAAY